MARMDDSSPHPQRWTNAKLMRQAKKYANLETFVYTFNGAPNVNANDVCSVTKLYRDTWLNPILEEIERRFVKER